MDIMENQNDLEQLMPNLDAPVSLEGRDKDFWMKSLKNMILIRECEIAIASLKELGLIYGPVHLAAGQEAIATGVSSFLNNLDHVFSAHRSHAHFLALNSDPYSLLAELLGKSSGASRGKGGSMHLWDGQSGFRGSVPIVAGTVPIALGAAFAEKYKGSQNIGVAYFGDGAIEEGVVHETLNLAKLIRAPLLFVCENNFFSSHMHITTRQPSEIVSRFARANLIEFTVVDGNNIGEVVKVSSEYIKRLRNGDGPFFIEAITYRHYGHVDWRLDIDVGIKRSLSDIQIWHSRDPITRLWQAMCNEKLLTEREFENLHLEARQLIEEVKQIAIMDSEPDQSDLMDGLFWEQGGSK